MPVPATPPAAERQLLRDTVRTRIRDAIIDGTLEPGERLHDDELIAWLQVSRTPIREALGDLVRAGLVEMAPNRYTKVAMPNADEAVEAVQTLGVLFGGAARLAVPRLSAGVTREIVRMIDVCLSDLDREDGPALNAHGIALFTTYVDHCGNAALVKLCTDVTDGLAYKLRVPDIVQVLHWESMAAAFVALREATEAGDPLAAELAAQQLHALPGRDPVA
ncbi:GntR family transcriptional regulator [Frigoribacterium sp. VKM Ac-2836]|uniref:GntR family transcriptional regulator n=1 Tax=Frigoribacterium sp. VKM Ac-2836 TaxID=2739014 RepID=UPI001564AF61|nr:GntR family transcriptional regulator [Frigoribacterium sp. VKM Ac-2836]NRD25061.1 GntR family transcriptional regulator [Frigoribacterium sp. VKM Ac-2836]